MASRIERLIRDELAAAGVRDVKFSDRGSGHRCASFSGTHGPCTIFFTRSNAQVRVERNVRADIRRALRGTGPKGPNGASA